MHWSKKVSVCMQTSKISVNDSKNSIDGVLDMHSKRELMIESNSTVGLKKRQKSVIAIEAVLFTQKASSDNDACNISNISLILVR